MGKQNIRYASYFIYSLIIFFTGFFIGKVFFHKKTPHKVLTQVQSTSHDYPLLNPMVHCSEHPNVNMAELKNFKPEIENYVNEAKKKYPDIFISYYFRDLNNGLWIGENEKEKFSPASLMKIPVMIAVLKEAQKNPDLLNTRILYEKKAFESIQEESGFSKVDGKEYTVNEYIEQMIQYSDNVASLILTKLIGEEKVAKVEDDMNLHISSAYNVLTNFVSVRSYSSLFRVLYNSSYLSKEMSERALNILTGVKYDKGIRASIPAQYVVAQKYGKRDMYDSNNHLKTLQLHNFGIVYYPGKPFLLGIMTRGSTVEVKEKIIRELTAITFKEFDKEMKEHLSDVVFTE